MGGLILRVVWCTGVVHHLALTGMSLCQVCGAVRGAGGEHCNGYGRHLYYFRWGRACVEGVCLHYSDPFQAPIRSAFLTLTGSRCTWFNACVR